MNTATIKLFQKKSLDTGKILKYKSNYPKQNSDKFRKTLTPPFIERQNADQSVTFTY